MDISELVSKNDKYILNTYNRKKICFKSGKSATLIDTNNKTYIDFLSGLGVNNLGYSHPVFLKAIEDNYKNIIHTSNLFHIESQVKLAKLIGEKSFEGKTFFCNSGAEANEAALKLIKKFGKENNKKKIIALKNSFHGRTLGALSLTGQSKYQDNFQPLINNIKFIDGNNIEELKNSIDDDTAGIFFEMIQGEGGVYPLSNNFIQEIQKLKLKFNFIVVVDDIQAGLSRTGKVFSFENYNFIPDIFTFAKAMAGGLPIGGMHVCDKFTDVLVPGDHASTFGGGQFITSVALKVFSYLSSDDFLNKLKKTKEYFNSKIFLLMEKYISIIDYRGMGLMRALEFENLSTNKIFEKSLNNGLIVNSINDKMIRFLPPLVITDDEIDEGFKILDSSIKEVMNE